MKFLTRVCIYAKYVLKSETTTLCVIRWRGEAATEKKKEVKWVVLPKYLILERAIKAPFAKKGIKER